jgi:hypothetical protein
MKNQFIDNLSFSTLTITEEIVFLEDATFIDPMTGKPRHAKLAIGLEIFSLFLPEVKPFPEKETISKDVATILADQDNHHELKRQIERIEINEFIFNIRQYNLHPDNPSDQTNYYEIFDIAPLPGGVRQNYSFSVSCSPGSEKNARIENGATDNKLSRMLKALALRYQFYLHARLQVGTTEKLTLRHCFLEDPFTFEAARQAFSLLPRASEYQERKDLSILNIKQYILLSPEDEYSSPEALQSHAEFLEELMETHCPNRYN